MLQAIQEARVDYQEQIGWVADGKKGEGSKSGKGKARADPVKPAAEIIEVKDSPEPEDLREYLNFGDDLLLTMWHSQHRGRVERSLYHSKGNHRRAATPNRLDS